MTKKILPTLIFKQTTDVYEELYRIKKYGADGVEIRRERLPDNVSLKFLRDLAKQIQKLEIGTVIYSMPFDLYDADSRINSQWQVFADETAAVKADALKLSLGNFSSDLPREDLAEALDKLPCKLLLENNQEISVSGSMLQNFAEFFLWSKGLQVAMTFDTGNWQVVGEDCAVAYEKLRDYIYYMHIKSVCKNGHGFTSIAPRHDDIWLKKACNHKLAAMEFPLNNPDAEAPFWLKKLGEK